MPRENPAVRRFSEIARLPDDELDVAEGALAIAAGADPDLEPGAWLEELDRMAAGVDDLERLISRLFHELGFQGDREAYYDPQNSLLHKVIQRRVGIPITLSVVVLAVGERSGIDLQGIGMPGHFLLRDADSGSYLDAFNRGERIDEHGCESLFRAATGADVAFGPELLPIVSKGDILERILSNLKTIYGRLGSYPDLEWVLRMRLALPTIPSLEVVELAHALSAQGRFVEAAKEIEARAEDDPEAADVLRKEARAIRARLN